MRIIAGQYRSRPLKSLPGLDLRPTSDRLRETLFNVLAAAGTLEGSVWLDLFAGTGAVGIEALSRGARQVYFVESERKHARLLRENLHSLKISEGFDVYESEASAALRSLDASGETCDFCFLDPPYQMRGAYERTLEFLGGSRLVGQSTIVIAEHEKRYELAETFGTLVRYRKIAQGDAGLSLYRVIGI
ncbi:MAG: 16S rRNA (guanine(966)-N(2))-methyltransferase RsmD [Candidatus Korobacteraceae bacterium]